MQTSGLMLRPTEPAYNSTTAYALRHEYCTHFALPESRSDCDVLSDPLYFSCSLRPCCLGLWAQIRVKSAFAQAEHEPAPLSGAAAARHVLDSAGLHNVAIEPVDGFLSDHYDPRQRCCG